MMNTRALPLALLSLSLGACASSPMHYYTLTPPLGETGAATLPCCKVHIRRVAVPPEVDRTEIVTRSGPDQVVVHGNEAWLAPLSDEIRSALGGEVTRRLSQAAPLATGTAAQEFAIWVNISRFDSVLAQYVIVTADWRVQSPAAPRAGSTVCATTVRVNVTEGMAALVQGYQQALAQIADRIALGLKNADGGAQSQCSAG